MDKAHLEEVAAYIREHRSNEENFEKLNAKLKEEAVNNTPGLSMQDIQTRADEYRKAKETGGSAWPEFEKFVSQFEKAVVEAIREAG
ncbi:MAG TPA: hypothetical protein VER36_02955 [Flavisolibacter sp.]|nr:hypothetical protein [Flavisolibacter sp.]